MSAITIHYQPKLPPIRAKADCRCSGDHALVVNQRMETVKGRNAIMCDAKLCMACGTIRPFVEYRHYHDALADFWREHGWHRAIGMRLTEFADLSTETVLQSHMALAAGMSPDEADQLFATNAKG